MTRGQNVHAGAPGQPLTASALGRLMFECDRIEFGENAVAWNRVSPVIQGYRIDAAKALLEYVDITWKGDHR